ncbi:MAG: LPS assembly protein LptD [Burkholderiaceae bacterium]|nr:LPS assembly protein LptD [Burkholderiaceae bacterium]
MPHLHPLALAAALLLSPAGAKAQGAAASNAPVSLKAIEIRGRPDLEVIAEGNVELQRGRVTIRTDRLSYDNVEDRARARGRVQILTAEGDRFSGPELNLRLQRFEGYFLQPEYFFARTGAGGRAERIDFLDNDRTQLSGATYTSCSADGGGTPAWLLTTDRVKLDFEANEGVAEGAVLRFLGLPILAAPVLSFPLSDARKSGWLPPSIDLDNKGGLEVKVPYYWNIAPQRDATLTPVIYSRRGLGLDSEFRYLEPRHRGELQSHWLPSDRVFGDPRYALQWQQRGFAFGKTQADALRWGHEGLRVSDETYWKDFPRVLRSLTPRLLPLATQIERDWVVGGLQSTLYARTQHWQVLQDADPQALISAPYHRLPQLGWRGAGSLPGWNSGLGVDFEAEINRFTLPANDTGAARPDGWRAHALASVSQTWRTPGAWLAPRLAFNLASYRTDTPMSDGRRSAARAIPTFSIDGGLVFERETSWFSRTLRQTLEPRVLYVNTPLRQQATLPLFDTAAKDFNTVSAFSDNAFSGVDRVSDAHQITAGVTTRLLDAGHGIETLRLGLAQRYLLRDQQITPDGKPLTQRFSDLLLVGSAHLSPRWTFDAALQYSPEIDRATRSVLSARYSPGAMHTLAASYRLARGASEHLDLGWQWPVYRGDPNATGGSGAICRGTLYSVGRINYSMKDSRITDSLVGFEYDTGCWIGRMVAERVSTGRTEATTRLLLQLELVGLSRLGSNPLQVLKDNIPGYKLLREDRADPPLRDYTH